MPQLGRICADVASWHGCDSGEEHVMSFQYLKHDIEGQCALKPPLPQPKGLSRTP
jgi:hypothetical protein